MSTIRGTEQGMQSTGEGAFLSWLHGWYENLPHASLRDDIVGEDDPSRVAVLVVDLLVGFCSEGALASERVGALGPRAAAFLARAREGGVRHFLLAADAHPPDSPEFTAFPPHCIKGTREAEIIPELTALPFYPEMSTFRKGSLSVGQEPGFGEWQAAHPEVTSWIIVGDCTDLCVYHAATYLRLQANMRGDQVRIWVPADLVDTYDLSVDIAQKVGALPHDGDLMHRLFLYHMALNGIGVVGSIGE